MQYYVLTPAHGRDFTNGKAAAASFDSGEDWIIASLGLDSGRYCSKRELPPGSSVELRFNNSRGLKMVKV